jgi:hypothetical protein
LDEIQLKIQSIKSTDVSQEISFLEKWKFLFFNFDIYFYKQKHIEYLQFSYWGILSLNYNSNKKVKGIKRDKLRHHQNQINFSRRFYLKLFNRDNSQLNMLKCKLFQPSCYLKKIKSFTIKTFLIKTGGHI